MDIRVETSKTYIVEFTEGDKQAICNEIKQLHSSTALKALQTILENPEGR